MKLVLTNTYAVFLEITLLFPKPPYIRCGYFPGSYIVEFVTNTTFVFPIVMR